MKRLLALALALIAACSSRAKAPRDDGPPELRALRAWARLYGVLRYWHPSDEAATLDWNRVAVLGVQRVRGAQDAAAIEAALEPIVGAFAPTVQLVHRGEQLVEPPAGPGDLVAWQYLGAGFDGGQPGTYAGKRTHRESRLADAAGWTAFSQTIDAKPHRGKQVRLRAHLKAETPGKAELWVRVDRAAGVGFFQNTQDRPVTGPTWQEITIDGTIDADADLLHVGGIAEGDGAAWFDDFTLEIGGAGIALENPGFEAGTAPWGGRIGGPESGYGWTVEDGGHTGKAVRVLAQAEVVTEDLFEGSAAAGEVADVDLGAGLRARVPLALWSRDGRTQPVADTGELVAALAALPAPVSTDADARVADVIVAWATLGQFSPYFEDTQIDWDAALDRALADALDDRTPADHHATLDHLGASLEDGHVFVGMSEDRPDAGLPVRLGWVEDRVVVVASTTPEVAAGDELTAIDGVPAAQALDAALARCSGTLQWRRHIALGRMVLGMAGTTATLALVRDGAARTVTLPRAQAAAPEPPLPAPVAELEAGLWYVDLERSTIEEIDAVMTSLAAARGVIFDLRGYPNGTHDVLAHLLDAPEADRWMHTPLWTHPALPGQIHVPMDYLDLGWDLQPVAPRIPRAVFLTGGGAISYAESVMGYVEALGLPIVGEATAGANGNVRSIALPTGASVSFTGMYVTRHDGTRSHGLGIAPTIPVTPTLAGIRAGKDEVLDRAVEAIKQMAPD